MGRTALAQGIWRTRREPHTATDLQRRADALQPALSRKRPGDWTRRTDIDALGQRGAAAALSEAHARGGRDLVPGLFRTRVRLGPRVATNARGRGRRLLRRQWAEGVDLRRASCRHVLPAGPHRPRRAKA